MDKYGIEAAFQYPSEIPCLSLDEASVHSLLEKVSTWGETSEAYNFLTWAAEKAQSTILDKILPEIESLTNGRFKNLPSLTLKIKKRIAIRDIPADQCLSHLEAVLEECVREDDYAYGFMEKAERICERMVEAGDSLPELEKLTLES